MSLPELRPCGSDVAAYALAALEPSETTGFEAHLRTCVVCRDELAAFQQIVDELPLAAAQTAAPKGLRRRVLADVRAEAASARDAEHRRASARRQERRPWGLPFARPAIALAGVVAVAAAVTGGIELTSSGHHTKVLPVSASLPAQGELHLASGHAELTVQHLAAPKAGHIYEVWLERGHQAPQPTKALFSVTRNGSGDVDVPGSTRGVTRVLVTQEPDGGSPHPTTPPVIVAAL